jgi:hypothetical protein
MGSPPGGQESYVTRPADRRPLAAGAGPLAEQQLRRQDPYNAAVNASFNDSKVDCALTHSSVVAAEENLLIE